MRSKPGTRTTFRLAMHPPGSPLPDRSPTFAGRSNASKLEILPSGSA
jgi:hypothetical protein